MKKPMLLKSTISTVGSETSMVVFGGKNRVLESIGQSGIIATSTFDAMEIQQGFLTNIRFYEVNNTDQPEWNQSIPIVISPNPFTDYIQIEFSVKTKYPIHLKIYDLNGKVFSHQTYPSAKSITVPMKKYRIGGYIVRLVSGQNKYVEKIFKVQ
ncbi:T9SS type A sorting domain-containing protein [Polaribacter sp. HL-MS24]|uniref:T9SS type A sorting domain-containing protein n=1 Tax=Polaribacter sp. HL-MS24 TaxID=3077735 RepID=UPI0029351FF9|nr:T9SS type A sorting domain-containing protein [Polaribacter sp. HL-MS24]WOC39350.1 T9SS type A sorting domain-containing protein [Polaribacter sp. HL-MS24]